MHAPYLTVVVPCYNESENLRRGVLDEMHSYLCEQDYAYEVVVSDDDSTDDSRDLVRQSIATKPAFRLVENAHGGKPSAVWGGIQAARGSIVLFTDMDQSTPIDQIARLLPRFSEGYDVVIGSRGYSRRDFPLYRRLGSAVFRAFRRLLLLRNISDTQCGFKAMRTDVARCLFPRLEAIARPTQASGWRVTAFDVELLYLAERAGLAIAEVVVEWSDRDVSRGKGKSYWRESKEMAEQVWRIKRNAWRGLYRMEDGPCE
ncbi:MAG TPA: glycosyltransferase [Chloroflexi bacterium]|nr:glycosyltransferase [Chloroflexota bacterium]